ncbi:glycosyltransferase [Alteromonas sp. ZYF713]|nr:glycosyltransferase [Alteromonas sp. ZYF713]
MFKSFPKSPFSKKKSTRSLVELIKKSGLFDSEWYLQQYPDVRMSRQEPIEHYLLNGAQEGRNPSATFDTNWYLNSYPDVRAVGINPLVHYIEHGEAEGRVTKSGSSSIGVKSSSTKVGELSKKLWGGFSAPALEELKQFANSNSNSSKDRAAAFYSLARWYGTNNDWAEVNACIKKIRPLNLQFYRSKRVKLLLVESYLQQGMHERASDFIAPTLENKFDSDFICALSNQPLSAKERLQTLNKIYTHYGLAELSFVEPVRGMAFGNIDVQTPLLKISGGPKVSILVPVFKAETFIRVAINSLLAQTWTNIEIIAVDDCSPDDSFKILQEIAEKDSRLKVFKNEVNLGAYGTRNKALSLAGGDFITVHDSDDWSHPQMLEVQLGAMMSDPLLKVTCSMMARVHDDMRFVLRPQRNNLDYVHRSYPSVLIRSKDLKQLGEWDGVSANADDEFVQRARILWGKDSVKDILTGVPLSFFLVHENSLTQNKKTSLNSLTFGIRHEYSRQAKYWKEHKVDVSADNVITKRTSLKEPFPIPAGLAPNNWPINRHYDLVIISDLSLLGGTRRCNEGYILAALNAGLRVGLFHWPRYDLKIAEIANEYTELSYNDNVDFLVHEDEISANLVIIHHPPILKYEIDAVPSIDCKKVGVLVNQSPMQLWTEEPHYYCEEDVNSLCVRLFKHTPVWIPISSVVEETMKLAGGGHSMHSEMWYPPYNHELPTTMPPMPESFGADRKIILGRHSRDHWTKWPKTAKDLKKAYCAESNVVDVKILGGAKTPKELLGGIPKNWEVLKFDSVGVSDFVHELDFFLHFTNEDYIEEFGRNVMEAMAAGKVVILPENYEIVFGDAAIYAKPQDVESIILAYWNDAEKYSEQAAKGFDFVVKNCSSSVVEQKIKSLLN